MDGQPEAHRTRVTKEREHFEVAAHRFCDLSKPGDALSLLNNGKYGDSARQRPLGTSLLRSSMYPGLLADEGEYHLTYSL